MGQLLSIKLMKICSLFAFANLHSAFLHTPYFCPQVDFRTPLMLLLMMNLTVMLSNWRKVDSVQRKRNTLYDKNCWSGRFKNDIFVGEKSFQKSYIQSRSHLTDTRYVFYKLPGNRPKGLLDFFWPNEIFCFWNLS